MKKKIIRKSKYVYRNNTFFSNLLNQIYSAN